MTALWPAMLLVVVVVVVLFVIAAVVAAVLDIAAQHLARVFDDRPVSEQ